MDKKPILTNPDGTCFQKQPPWQEGNPKKPNIQPDKGTEGGIIKRDSRKAESISKKKHEEIRAGRRSDESSEGTRSPRKQSLQR